MAPRYPFGDRSIADELFDTCFVFKLELYQFPDGHAGMRYTMEGELFDNSGEVEILNDQSRAESLARRVIAEFLRQGNGGAGHG